MGEVREGFLCPMCMQDLGTVVQLQDHFEVAHSNEDKKVVEQLKGLFAKAKKKILNKQESEESILYNADPTGSGPSSLEPPGGSSTTLGGTGAISGIDPSMWEPQELGITRSHTDYMKRIRDARIDRFVVETNKLLIRLDKLIGPDCPQDAGKRKAYEKSIVQWAPDKDVAFCITCGKKFGLMVRRHHCRLCGGIMCNKCSQFLPFELAQTLTNPAYVPENEMGMGFKRSGSNTSLNSMISPEGEQHMRTCCECRKLLELRYKQQLQRTTKPILVQFYEKLRMNVDKAESMLPKYLEMAESLSAGENTYRLPEAQDLRTKVLKLYEAIDVISKRIAGLGMNQEELPSPKTQKLQKTVRAFASMYLQEHMMGLQPLPNEQELKKLQEARKIEIERRIAQERQIMIEREQKRLEEKQRKVREKGHVRNQSADSGLPSGGGAAKREGSGGWKPMEVQTRETDDDPMVQQMNIIRGYIKQALDAERMSEVEMFQTNLKELQQAYLAQQSMKARPK
ncbi:unnamed protein product [Owenia fusiformis]|uniref:Uncharacterized protein n=1 Tax=Owenia fusiformis TaxID=6347 RepID=A0A8J1T6J9_OWEFU|nr:unnamed protein product [Owenia fusiformis]